MHFGGVLLMQTCAPTMLSINSEIVNKSLKGTTENFSSIGSALEMIMKPGWSFKMPKSGEKFK